MRRGVADTADPECPALREGAASQIDARMVRVTFGEDTALFVSLLARLLRDFSEFALPISIVRHDAGALVHLVGRLHKLGGGAGMVGATTVHRLAGAAESALAAGQAPEMVGTLMIQLAAALTALGEELSQMRAGTPNTNPDLAGKIPVPLVATPKSIARLLELLDNHDMDGLEHLSAMSLSLNARLGKACFAHLQEAVQGLDFAIAAAILRDSRAFDDRLATEPRKSSARLTAL